MKVIGLVLGLMLITGMAFAQNVNITITIPSEKAAIALEGFLTIYPNNETIPDPAWKFVEGEEAPQIPRWNNKEWVREQLRRLLIRDVRRGLQMKASAEAQVAEDDGIAQ